jgi:hypothetical protein
MRDSNMLSAKSWLSTIDEKSARSASLRGKTDNGTEVKAMKLGNALLALLFLIGLGASSCATMRGPMTEEEEEEVARIQEERWPQMTLSEAGGDND